MNETPRNAITNSREDMHVCFLFHREFLQDCSTSMNEYPQKLAQAGVRTTVIAARNSRDEPARETINGVDVHRIYSDTSTALSFKPTLFGYRALRKLDELCQTQDIDVLHMSSFPVLGAILRPLPWLDSPPATVVDVRHPAVRNWLFDAIARTGIRLQRRLVDQMVVIDQNVAENLFSDTSDISILHLGTDLKAFAPDARPDRREAWRVDDDDLVIGYTGTLNEARQLHTMIDAFERVHRDYPATKLVIVGDGNDRDRLERRAAESSASDAIHFTGLVDYEAMPSYVSSFDIGFAYIPDLKQYRDQPPSKTVEFLSANLAVLATDTPGNRRYVIDGENGLLVDDTVDGYVDGLARLVADPELRERLTDKARKSIDQFDYQSIVETELIPTYERILNERASERRSQSIPNPDTERPE